MSLSFKIAINKYSQGFMEIYKNKTDLLKANDFELPYDIAENISHMLSYVGEVELISEYSTSITLKNGKVINSCNDFFDR